MASETFKNRTPGIWIPWFAMNPDFLGPSWAKIDFALRDRRAWRTLRPNNIFAQEGPRTSGLNATIGLYIPLVRFFVVSKLYNY